MVFIGALMGITKEDSIQIKKKVHASHGRHGCLVFFVHQNGMRRKFTAEECEQLQTLPVGYTKAAGSDNARAKLIGNAWTISVIRAILYPIFN